MRYFACGREERAVAGLHVVQTASEQPRANCAGHLFFVHDRQNNLDHARGYLAWEVGLIDQMDEQEKGVFRV